MNGKYPSHHLLNKSHFNKIEEKKYLINTSRGEVLSDEYFQTKGEKFIFDVWPKENDMDFTIIETFYCLRILRVNQLARKIIFQ